jgi:hypothetical protein
MCKSVQFNDNTKIFITYSSDEYDRSQIDSCLYQKSYNRISQIEWKNIVTELHNFKKLEMIVHINNRNSIKLY